jgi:hypothetical protein
MAESGPCREALPGLHAEGQGAAAPVEELRKKEKGTGGGIRIVLPSVLADPFMKPGQKPPPLRLLGQDPSKPLSDATGTAADAQPSLGAVRTHEDRARKSAHARSTSPAITSPQQRLHRSPFPALAPNSEDAFDPAELIEDFEYPICQICMGTRMVRDENGIHIVTCPYCEGAGGRRPRRESGPWRGDEPGPGTEGPIHANLF